MKLLVLLLVSVFSLFSGKPASDAGVFLEKGAKKEPVAYQKTGQKGEVAFKHLDAGSYRLLLTFPQQEGKYIKEKPKHQTMTKATYNPRSKTYYYQGMEGFFAVKLSGISKIKSDNFRAVFKEERGETISRIVIAEFGAHRNGAAVSVQVKAITAAQFKKAAEKAGGDISTLSIRGMK